MMFLTPISTCFDIPAKSQEKSNAVCKSRILTKRRPTKTCTRLAPKISTQLLSMRHS